eukprot:TRINITY_DN23130_c0_g2_i1.p1 TRINITY_DN23130_c0_g2~~TRINITY_DN23130_c0_g2_i1.p1  ORF type:complete len:184 (+),score=30.16 TRINITY_DN23130_c0_g2_i1:73-624(+)
MLRSLVGSEMCIRDRLRTPPYLTQNFLSTLPKHISLQSAWPSLFLGGNQTGAGIHMDAWGTHYWMLQITGQKEWLVYPKADLAALYYNPFNGRFGVKGLEQPNYDQFPLLRWTQPWKIVLQPGELLLLPQGSPHAVRNLGLVLSIAGNYVDEINYDVLVEEVKLRALECTNCLATRLQELLIS